MKVLIFWDIYGRLGRKALKNELPRLQAKYNPDLVIANIENITSGKWPTKEHARFVSSLWVDMMTSGDHIFDQDESITEYLRESNSNLIRPANFYGDSELPGLWYMILEKSWVRVLLIQLLGEVFMNHKVQNPFLYIEDFLTRIDPKSYDLSIVDFHRETTAELYGMGYFLDTKVSLVYGTHTHVQTSDAHILPGWTGIIADVWMNGPHNSIIWASFESVKPRFLSGIAKGKILQQTHGPYHVSAVFAELDNNSWLCTHIESIFYTEHTCIDE